MRGADGWALLNLYVLVQALGLLVRPLAARLFPTLPDRGYGASRILGILLFGYLFWLLYAVGLVSNNGQGAWIALAICTVIGALAARHAPPFRVSLSALLHTEFLFLIAFLGWAIFRSIDPAVAHTEQPMDLMMMNSLWTSADFPPGDAWLSGAPIGYYYFGYWLIVALGRAIHQPPELLYNAGQALWFALLLSGLFGLAINLLWNDRNRRIPRAALMGGWLTALAVGVGGNFQGVIDTLSPTDETFWWWPASRPLHDLLPDGRVVDLITEFPFFSYLIGDNHPHLLAMPAVLFSLRLILDLWCRPDTELLASPVRSTAFRRTFPIGILTVLALSFSLGALLFLNAWDYPVLWLLMSVALFRHFRFTPAFFVSLIGITTGSFILFLPYHLYAQSQVMGVTLNTSLHINPLKLLRVFGLFLPGIILLGLQASDLRRMPSGSGKNALSFLALCAAAGLLLVAIPEAVYVHDLFGHRMNTVFKFYYQAWLLLGFSAACAVTCALAKKQYAFMSGFALFALLAGLIYPGRVFLDPPPPSANTPQLSVLAQLERTAPDEAEALRWIAAQTPVEAVVAEACGASYATAFNRVSAFTGRKTLLGWTGHEVQWRGKAYPTLASGRETALNELYTSGQPNVVHSVIRRWKIDYVYLGPAERLAYNITPEMEKQIAQMIKPVWSNRSVCIYRVPRS